MTSVKIPVSAGDLVDKITILTLKSEQISDPAKRENVLLELSELQNIASRELQGSNALSKLWEQLSQINADLWAIEEDLRSFEMAKDFGPAFVALARSVYIKNDERAAVKRRINFLLKSTVIEEKSYGAAGRGS